MPVVSCTGSLFHDALFNEIATFSCSTHVVSMHDITTFVNVIVNICKSVVVF